MSDDAIQILVKPAQIDMFLEYVRDLVSAHDRIHAAWDFEFDRVQDEHVLSLAQLMLSSYSGSVGSFEGSGVYVMDFRLFSKKQFHECERIILTNPKVIKIFHGSESLDLPGLRNIMSSERSFKELLSQMQDTRFLCEAHHILMRKKNIYLKKCNIYDALKNTDTITQDEYSKLSGIKINYHKRWNIRRLDPKQLVYAAADVMFLHNLYLGYVDTLGHDLVGVIMESYRYAVMSRMSLIPPNPVIKTDMVGRLRDAQVLQKILAQTRIGPFTIDDLIGIDYLKKSAIHLAYTVYVHDTDDST